MRFSRILFLSLLVLFPLACNMKKYKDTDDEPRKTMTFQPGTGAAPAVMAVTPAVDRKVAANDLRNIWMMGMADSSVPPPASFEQFADLRQGPSRIYNAVKEGHYLVCWKADRNKPNAIFAYWNEVPKKGGPVVLVNGDIKENMSAQEFQNTPKAGVVTPAQPPAK